MTTFENILLGFVEGFFVVSIVIYICTQFSLNNPVNLLFHPSLYPFLFSLGYTVYKRYKQRQTN